MSPAFEDLLIDFWIDAGKLGISQPTLCVYHDQPKIGVQFFDALCELENCPQPARCVLTFKGCSRDSALRKLMFTLVDSSDELKVLNIRVNRDTATIQMTNMGLSLIRHAFSSWLEGFEDFGVSPRNSQLNPKEFGRLDCESGELWFWGPTYTGPQRK